MAFAAYFERLDQSSEVVIEAYRNEGTRYDVLEENSRVSKVVLSHLAENRNIADAQIKNDRIDANAMATLLRVDFVAKVHAVARRQATQKRRAPAPMDGAGTHDDQQPASHRYRPATQARAACGEGHLLPSTRSLDEARGVTSGRSPVARRRPLVARGAPSSRRCHGDDYRGQILRVRRARVYHAYLKWQNLVWPNAALLQSPTKWAFIEAAWVAVGCSDHFGSFYRKQRVATKAELLDPVVSRVGGGNHAAAPGRRGPAGLQFGGFGHVLQ